LFLTCKNYLNNYLASSGSDRNIIAPVQQDLQFSCRKRDVSYT
jgi:hypothetical protein